MHLSSMQNQRFTSVHWLLLFISLSPRTNFEIAIYYAFVTSSLDYYRFFVCRFTSLQSLSPLTRPKLRCSSLKLLQQNYFVICIDSIIFSTRFNFVFYFLITYKALNCSSPTHLSECITPSQPKHLLCPAFSSVLSPRFNSSRVGNGGMAMGLSL